MEEHGPFLVWRIDSGAKGKVCVGICFKGAPGPARLGYGVTYEEAVENGKNELAVKVNEQEGFYSPRV